MEQNIKQHTLTFEKGLTTVPSDITSPDNTLNEAHGLVYLDGEYKPLQNPNIYIDIDGELLYVHRLNDGQTINYISKKNTSLLCNSTHFATISGILDVKAIGNTLIVNTSSGLQYFLWSESEYESIGSKIPVPDVSFNITRVAKDYISSFNANEMGYCVPIVVNAEREPNNFICDPNHNSDFENGYMGSYAELKSKIKKDGRFLNPFFIRFALELFDGTYTYISAPYLVYTFLGENIIWNLSGANIYNDESKGGELFNPKYFTCHSNAVAINIKQTTDYSKYKDLIRGVSIFATTEVERFSERREERSGYYDQRIFHSEYAKGNHQASFCCVDNNVIEDITIPYNSVRGDDNYKGLYMYKLLKPRSDNDIKTDLKALSVFFKIADLGIQQISSFTDIKQYMKENTITNLTTQDQLAKDDFYSHTTLYPKNIQTFNRRLNIYNVKRSFFNGFTEMVDIEGDDGEMYNVFVRIKVTGKSRIVGKACFTKSLLANAFWFFYPDPRADHVWVFANRQCVLSKDLEEHPYLNGAYYMADIPTSSTIPTPTTIAEEQPAVYNTPETLPNYLLQSEVDSPFTFSASGYVRVGQGTILGMAGLTTALSQDAYKISTTIVFTTQGIWALKINDQGQYTSVAPPFSREVLYTDSNGKPGPICMTDNAVFFVSKKGLMCVTGESESSVVCVSQNLKDSLFITHCNSQNCRLAYDYKERLLYVLNLGTPDAYIYSISTGTWTYDDDIFASMHDLAAVVNDYPDTYLQCEAENVYSLLSRPNRNSDTNRYSFDFTSRPLKLSGSLIPESIRRIKHLLHPDIKVFTSQADYDAASSTTPSMLMTIKASNDLRTWGDITSVGGAPHRFFRLSYKFKNLLAIHTFAATILLTQHRHTNRFI